MNNRNITPTFKLVFFTVVSMTMMSGGISVWLAYQDNLSEQQNRVFETSSATWQMGVGAVFGLLGSQAADLLHQDDEDE